MEAIKAGAGRETAHEVIRSMRWRLRGIYGREDRRMSGFTAGGRCPTGVGRGGAERIGGCGQHRGGRCAVDWFVRECCRGGNVSGAAN